MATLSTIRTRISSRYKGSNSASFLAEIDTAINEAVEYYNTQDMWFREKTASLTLTVGANDLTAHASWPTDFWYFDQDSPVRIFYSGRPYRCERVTPGEYDDQYSGITGRPQIFREQSGKVEIYPIPDQGYVCEVKYIKKYSTLTSDTDTNDWLTYAPQLIQARALSQLFLGQGHDGNNMFTHWRNQEAEAFAALKLNNIKRKATGNLRTECI